MPACSFLNPTGTETFIKLKNPDSNHTDTHTHTQIWNDTVKMEDHTPVWPLWQSIYITCFQRLCWWQLSQGVSTSLIGTLNFTLVQHQIIAGVKQPYIHTLTQKQSRALKDGKVELVVMFQKMHGTHSFKKPPCNLEYTTLCRRQAKMTKKLKPREWVGLKCSECTEFIPAVTNQAESGLQALIWATDSDGFHQLSPNQEREHEKKEKKGKGERLRKK